MEGQVAMGTIIASSTFVPACTLVESFREYLSGDRPLRVDR